MLEMLKFKRLTLKGEDWIIFVNRTQENILNSPSQYLSNVTERNILEKVVKQIFEEFVAELNSNAKPKENIPRRLLNKGW